MNRSSRKFDHGVLEDNGNCRSSEFLRLCEDLPEVGFVRTSVSVEDPKEDEFMRLFKKLYLRLPPNFRGRPPDQGVEIVKTRLLLAALKNLISDLKAKP